MRLRQGAPVSKSSIGRNDMNYGRSVLVARTLRHRSGPTSRRGGTADGLQRRQESVCDAVAAAAQHSARPICPSRPVAGSERSMRTSSSDSSCSTPYRRASVASVTSVSWHTPVLPQQAGTHSHRSEGSPTNASLLIIASATLSSLGIASICGRFAQAAWPRSARQSLRPRSDTS